MQTLKGPTLIPDWTSQPVVGVTGHRYLCEIDRVLHGVDTALDRIETFLKSRTYVVLSALAEGSDRLAAHQALRRGASLAAVLPLPQSEYLKDFQDQASKGDFLDLLRRAKPVVELPPRPNRSDCYYAAGIFVLDHCSVLLSVWDGKPPQGKGGTGAIVAEAHARGIPVAWVHAGNRRPGTNEPTSLGKEQGQVTLKGFGNTSSQAL